jgi:predicted nucleotidyltransferase
LIEGEKRGNMKDFQNLNELIDRLKESSAVIGIVRYGSRLPEDMSSGGDFDLFVFLGTSSLDLESLHFYIDDIPVDINLRTLKDLDLSKPISFIDFALMDGDILYDETGILEKKISSLKQRWKIQGAKLTENEKSWERFSQKHILDKVKGRINKEPLLCEFLLNTNIYWLIQNYFRVRRIPYPGEKDALKRINIKDNNIHNKLEDFYSTKDLKKKFEISEELTELVLAPIRGPWRKGELLSLSRNKQGRDIQLKGKKLLNEIFHPSGKKD